MRGIGLLGETVGSQVCPSCLWRIASQNGSSWPSRDPLELLRSPTTFTRRPSSRRKRTHRLRWGINLPRAIHESAVPKLLSGEEPDFSSLIPGQNIGNHSRDQVISDGQVQDHATQQIDIRAILEEGQPARIMAGFLGSPEFQRAVHELPATTFVEVFRLLSPEYFIEPNKKIQSRLHPTTAYLNRILPHCIVIARFAARLESIASLRRAYHKLGLAEYTHLLSCSASMGYGRMAHSVWEAMARDRIEPTVECYNYFMEARVWDNAYVAKENHRLRSTLWIYEKRRRWWSNPGYRGYKTGKGGVRDEVHQLFDTMVKSGLNPNESTFIQIMTAASREWDVKAVKVTLKTVWNIDVDLLEKDPNNHPQVTVYATTSPLHPSSRLLYAVAHIFGSNNDFAMALKLVDFISQNYSIPIPQRVWQELLQWSFILSIERFGKHARENMVGKIPRDSPSKLFDVLISPPYNAIPNHRMYDIVVKLGWIEQSRDYTFQHMRAGRSLFLETLRTRDHSFHELSKMYKELATMRKAGLSSENLSFFADETENTPGIDDRYSTLSKPAYKHQLSHLYPSIKSPGPYWDLYNKLKLLNIKVAREVIYIQRWIRLVLTRRKWVGPKELWERQGIPDFIQEWREFLPYRVFYHTKTGTVEFDPVSFFPKDHQWDLARFMLPLWDADEREVLDHHGGIEALLKPLDDPR
ncbi:hypothetical protein PRK78_006548 [Emydomyces testavorans]|uniref:Pentatricopeptide repeat domain-containing protein n=1 Tax=Emydomyces testavorans TaxID=2070801 RepID=A0AAF0DLL5_9EURO|nr:hypothetical protein PRK78_006548 [Emydomyces testavorans]